MSVLIKAKIVLSMPPWTHAYYVNVQPGFDAIGRHQVLEQADAIAQPPALALPKYVIGPPSFSTNHLPTS